MKGMVMKCFVEIITMLFLGCIAFAADALATPPSAIPPGEADAKARLNASPRHGEWVNIDVPNSKAPLKTFVVYPERADKAPVVIVIMEIFGETDWLRSVADQLAAEGFIAVVPDLLSGKGPGGGGTDAFPDRQAVTKMVSSLPADEVAADINAARDYGIKLPSASGKTATIGFCWGGGQSFNYVVQQPALSAAVVYYGQPPRDEDLSKVHCPVIGFYGGDDNRITSTVKPTEEKMKKLNLSYEAHVYEGAGHGFLRAQDDAKHANLKAAQQAWPATIAFLKEHTK
jgi:carboxymethylenebutenolidase